MIALLDTSEDLKVCETELGCPVEQLLTPLTRFTSQYPDERFAIDNGAYSNFDTDGFLSLLEREKERRNLCRFVAVPDVVGSARRTLEVFDHWSLDAQLRRWPMALVIQDGQEDLAIPWDRIEAVFIGGTDKFKLGPHVAPVVKAAKALGKWAHVGRVNTPDRFDYFAAMGVDSIDGSGLARYSHMRQRIHAPRLWDDQNRKDQRMGTGDLTAQELDYAISPANGA